MAVGLVSLFAFFALLQLIGTALASALTTGIGANERLCFYADVDKAGEKIGVSRPRNPSPYPFLTLWNAAVLLCCKQSPLLTGRKKG